MTTNSATNVSNGDLSYVRVFQAQGDCCKVDPISFEFWLDEDSLPTKKAEPDLTEARMSVGQIRLVAVIRPVAFTPRIDGAKEVNQHCL